MKYLIAGLGNIGAEYHGSRHNVGFDIADELAAMLDAAWTLDKLALRTSGKFKGRQLILIKPTTYMNLSGKAVRYWMHKEQVAPENLLVLVDDLALDFGTIRMRGKGSDGGHNGLKDIQRELGSTAYPRLRFGIGSDFGRGQQVGYVLGKWSEEERKLLPEKLAQSVEMVQSFCTTGLARTMNLYNNK